ncbi:MAG: (2Fe-2S) ferredoxin domain-containing protein [Sporomusaceae bacterium]|jgi:NADH-quinone oxidoreductase subunit F/NADP-reducing hydrogenase subunit HndC|nr:(2Fe-2S) ferredoxin domain-containing protein [Sporomusaceae bacterium]
MQRVRAHVLICAGTGCVSSGSKKVQAKFQTEIAAKGLSEEV